MDIGFSARLFPGNWRPISEEIAFAAAHGLLALQVRGPASGLSAKELGAPLAAVAESLAQTGVALVMELLVAVSAGGEVDAALHANRAAIATLGIRRCHVHAVRAPAGAADAPTCEDWVLAELAGHAAELAAAGCVLGLEHNSPEGLFWRPEAIAAALAAIPELGFVWDLNHTRQEDIAAFAACGPRLSMLHVSDTCLPRLNDHLPLGLGAIDWPALMATVRPWAAGKPAILEVGGLPHSGGYGRDTDAALLASAQLLRTAWETTGGARL